MPDRVLVRGPALSPILTGDVSTLLEKFTLATFRDRLGSTFRVSPDGSPPVTMALIEMTDLTSGGGPEAAHRARVPFSLVFRGPQAPVLPQRIYRIEHVQIGAFELFLVPIGPERDALRGDLHLGLRIESGARREDALKRDAETIAGESTPVSFGEQSTGGHQRGRDAAARWWITRTSG